MKRTLFMIFASLLSITSYSMPTKRIDIDNLSMVKLNNIQENRITFNLGAPGKRYSGSCSIVVRTRRGFSDDIIKLADKFNFTNSFNSTPVTPVISTRGSLIFPLKDGVFVDGITIETKNGKSIAENITSFAPSFTNNYSDIGVLSGICA